MSSLLHQPAGLLFTFVLFIVFPFADAFVYRRLQAVLHVYLWNILSIWTLTLLAVALLYRYGFTLTQFGQNLGVYARNILTVIAVVILVVAVIFLNTHQKRKMTPEQYAEQIENIRKLIPATPVERLLAIPLAFTAGFCEEFLYRGYLLNIAASATKSLRVGLLTSSILFGFAHLYQGRKGVIGTSLGGIVFGLIFLGSRSLLPGHLLHTAMDLTQFLALSKKARSQ
ncbi:MAG TPA: type II CAAX endopeptidase family protein [Candidatus Acidoferrales bacterium]|jgi:membrane protease YdiL (CAAX protease family)|nr:type II CAAX endopeptidase family protein [Candidatus Acidoferrales bacterium]